jgi:hypothetical protein
MSAEQCDLFSENSGVLRKFTEFVLCKRSFPGIWGSRFLGNKSWIQPQAFLSIGFLSDRPPARDQRHPHPLVEGVSFAVRRAPRAVVACWSLRTVSPALKELPSYQWGKWVTVCYFTLVDLQRAHRRWYFIPRCRGLV